MTKRVSVAMTTYRPNKEFLRMQLDSIREQTRPVDEVVICDDCSGDETPAFLNEYLNEHGLSGWRVLSNQENIGFTKNFALSLSECTGDIIFLCDQDDIWMPNKVEVFLDYFDMYPDIHSLVGNFNFIDAESQRITVERNGDNKLFLDWGNRVGDDLYRVDILSILGHNIAPGATQALRSDVRDLFLKVQGKRREHDWRINILAALAYDGLHYTTRVCTLYRLHSANSIGLSTRYQILPSRASVPKRVVWTLELCRTAVTRSWKRRKKKYPFPPLISPAVLKKRYFTVFDPVPAAAIPVKRWSSFARAKKRAISEKSFLRFLKIRIKYLDCNKALLGYAKPTERFEWLMCDLFYCLSGRFGKT